MQVAPFRHGATSQALYTVGLTVGLAVGCEVAGLLPASSVTTPASSSDPGQTPIPAQFKIA